MAKKFGNLRVIEAAQGMEVDLMSEETERVIRHYKLFLDVPDLSEVSID